MTEPLRLPMMMFGTFTSKVTKKDANGKAIKKNGKYVYVSSKVNHCEEDGDKGIFPSVNHMYVNMARGRKRLHEGAEKLKEKWNVYAKMWANDQEWSLTDGEKVVIEMTPYFPNDKIKRDASNAFKLMLDAFEGVIYENDFYALPRINDFHRIKEGEDPYFEVNIYKKVDEYHVLLKRLREAGFSVSENG